MAANYVPRAKSGAYDCLIVQGLDLDGGVGYAMDCSQVRTKTGNIKINDGQTAVEFVNSN